MDSELEYSGAFYSAVSSANLQSTPIFIGQKLSENWLSLNYFTKKNQLYWMGAMPPPDQPESSDCIKRLDGYLSKADCKAPMEFLCEDK
jgi:hypothetical protein